mgnify:CR=1 FL=1
MLRRRLLWHTGGLRFARPRPEVECPYLRAEHATPLLRRLRGEDMALQRSKVTNLRLAAARLDGLTLRPGETLSFWRAVGRPTRRRGYVEGMILRNGRVASGVGGGLCQMTNLLYWMTLHTPLTSPSGGGTATTCFPTPTAPSPFGQRGHLLLQLHGSHGAQRHPRHLAAGAPGDGHPSGGGSGGPTAPRPAGTRSMRRSTRSGGSTGAASPGTTPCSAGCWVWTARSWGEEFITENHAIMMYNPMLEETAP